MLRSILRSVLVALGVANEALFDFISLFASLSNPPSPMSSQFISLIEYAEKAMEAKKCRPIVKRLLDPLKNSYMTDGVKAWLLSTKADCKEGYIVSVKVDGVWKSADVAVVRSDDLPDGLKGIGGHVYMTALKSGHMEAVVVSRRGYVLTLGHELGHVIFSLTYGMSTDDRNPREEGFCDAFSVDLFGGIPGLHRLGIVKEIITRHLAISGSVGALEAILPIARTLFELRHNFGHQMPEYKVVKNDEIGAVTLGGFSNTFFAWSKARECERYAKACLEIDRLLSI